MRPSENCFVPSVEMRSQRIHQVNSRKFYRGSFRPVNAFYRFKNRVTPRFKRFGTCNKIFAADIRNVLATGSDKIKIM